MTAAADKVRSGKAASKKAAAKKTAAKAKLALKVAKIVTRKKTRA